jgi:hypothetical protein
MAGIQPIEKFSSKHDFAGPNGLLTPGNPSIEVGASPPISMNEFPGGRKPFGLPKIEF